MDSPLFPDKTDVHKFQLGSFPRLCPQNFPALTSFWKEYPDWLLWTHFFSLSSGLIFILRRPYGISYLKLSFTIPCPTTVNRLLTWLEAFNSQVFCVSGFPHKYKKKTKQQTPAASLFWCWDGETQWCLIRKRNSPFPVEKEHRIIPLMNRGKKVWRSYTVCSSQSVSQTELLWS